MPLYLADSSMIWGILAIGFLSQMILIMLSKWLASNFSTKVIKVLYSSLESEWFVFLPLPDFFFILIKITVITLGYAEMVHQIIYPSMNPTWMIIFIFLVSCYVAIQGMGNTIRFFVIAFLCTFWMIFISSFFLSANRISL